MVHPNKLQFKLILVLKVTSLTELTNSTPHLKTYYHPEAVVWLRHWLIYQ